jgi:hypothetical protein
MKRFTLLFILILGLSSCGINEVKRVESVFQGVTKGFLVLQDCRTGFSDLFAHNSDKKYEEQQPKAITKQYFHRDQEGVVEVVMKVDSEGKLKVVNLSATNEELAKYVMLKLKDMSNKSPSSTAGQVIKYRFVFKKQV